MRIPPTFRPWRFWNRPPGVALAMVSMAFFFMVLWLLSIISARPINLPVFLGVSIGVLLLGALGIGLVRHIRHCASMLAVLDIVGTGGDAIIVMTHQSSIIPKPSQREWHATDIECISNSNWDPDRGQLSVTTLHLTLVGGKRVCILNQLTQIEREWVVKVLQDQTGLKSDFEIAPAGDSPGG